MHFLRRPSVPNFNPGVALMRAAASVKSVLPTIGGRRKSGKSAAASTAPLKKVRRPASTKAPLPASRMQKLTIVPQLVRETIEDEARLAGVPPLLSPAVLKRTKEAAELLALARKGVLTDDDLGKLGLTSLSGRRGKTDAFDVGLPNGQNEVRSGEEMLLHFYLQHQLQGPQPDEIAPAGIFNIDPLMNQAPDRLRWPAAPAFAVEKPSVQGIQCHRPPLTAAAVRAAANAAGELAIHSIARPRGPRFAQTRRSCRTPAGMSPWSCIPASISKPTSQMIFYKAVSSRSPHTGQTA